MPPQSGFALVWGMKQALLFSFFLCQLFAAQTQNLLTGNVLDAQKSPVAGATLYLKGTFDGTVADSLGKFSLKTTATGAQTLVVSALGFLPQEIAISVQAGANALPDAVLAVNPESVIRTVVITAGTFEASDEKKQVVLRPLDIVTTAGAAADVSAALQTLPGVSRVGEQEGLFVRGGSASETKTVIDGLIVQNPFYSSVPDLAQRGRFSPFLFKGTAFSTGGYSAQYGQALSSVMVLNTTDMPEKSGGYVGLNAVGASAGVVHKREKLSLGVDGSYFNAGLLFKMNPQTRNWTQTPEGGSGSFTMRWQPKAGHLLKVYTNFTGNHMAIDYPNPLENDGTTSFKMRNQNLYTNATYRGLLGKWLLNAGFSQSVNHDDLHIDTLNVLRADTRTQTRATLTREFSRNFTLTTGAEVHQFQYQYDVQPWKNSVKNLYAAAFTEADVYLTDNLVGRFGARAEYSDVIGKFNAAPRLSLALKTSKNSQISLASGIFFQDPEVKYLYLNKNLGFEQAAHFLLNYQYMANDRTFRVEAYRKQYSHLVREIFPEGTPFSADPYRFPTGATNNSGYGYAQGVDFFWRDKKTFQNLDYWVSYSWLDTKRLFANYPKEVQPTFAAAHTLTVVTKYWISKLSTNVGLTYAYASGRAYYNPNSTVFMGDRTPDMHSLSFSGSYLTMLFNRFAVVYFGVDNLTGRKNVFGYRYTADGSQRIPVSPPTYRSFFFGLNLSLAKS